MLKRKVNLHLTSREKLSIKGTPGGFSQAPLIDGYRFMRISSSSIWSAVVMILVEAE